MLQLISIYKNFKIKRISWGGGGETGNARFFTEKVKKLAQT